MAAAAVPLPGRVPDPHPYVYVIADLVWELWETRRELVRALGLPPEPRRPVLYLVEAAPDELEPEWDSGDSNAYQDRIEAGLEPED